MGLKPCLSFILMKSPWLHKKKRGWRSKTLYSYSSRLSFCSYKRYLCIQKLDESICVTLNATWLYLHDQLWERATELFLIENVSVVLFVVLPFGFSTFTFVLVFTPAFPHMWVALFNSLDHWDARPCWAVINFSFFGLAQYIVWYFLELRWSDSIIVSHV